MAALAPSVVAQTAEANQPPAPQDNRAYGVLPNYRTAESSTPFSAITSKQKITIAWKDSMNGPSYVMGGLFSAISQVNNTNPSFGQGLKGYTHRYFTALADQDLGNMMTEGILPSLFRDDPRFFRKGKGGGWARAGYAASRVLVTRSDKDTWRFNSSEVLIGSRDRDFGPATLPHHRTCGFPHPAVELSGFGPQGLMAQGTR